MARSKDRIYRLLALIYPWKDIAAAEWTLQHGDPRSRASASEYLDNVLSGQLRKRIMPLLEDLPVEEKVRRGNVLIKSRPRDVEESLLQLINDDDQVVAAAAIDVVRQHQIWSLADDIEHVLAHRDVRDWYVFEAASWALAEKRMPADRRRELWREPLPAAELAGRLRTLPLFASVSVDELFRIVSAARQVRHDPGSTLLKEGTVPLNLHLLLDGTVVATAAEAERHVIEPPSAARLQRSAAGAADARDDADGRSRGHAGALDRGAPDAARRQHRSRQRSVRHAVGAGSRKPGPGAADFRGRRARAAGSWRVSRRSRRSSRCRRRRSSAAPLSKRCSRLPL